MSNSLNPIHLKLNTALSAVFGDQVAFVIKNINTCHGQLLAEEEALVANAVPKRQQEFRAGRQALTTLGHPDSATTPLLKGTHGEVLWPQGYQGTISHSGNLCIAALTKQALKNTSIGIDIEQFRQLDIDIQSIVCCPHEAQWLKALPETQQAQGLLFLFSAKEAFYKSHFPLHQQFLEFRDVAITPSTLPKDLTIADTNYSLATCNDTVATHQCQGSAIFMDDYIITCAKTA